MKTFNIVTKVIFVLCLPVLLISASVAIAANSTWLYEKGFEKYNISQVTGLDKLALHEVATGLISYFNSGEEYIHVVVTKDGQPFTVFNEREELHLKDVKGMLQTDYKVLAGTLIYALAFLIFYLRRKDKKGLAWTVFRGSALTLILLLVLGIGTLLDFSQLFLQFHLFSFTNDLWILDPTKDYLIMLFPEGFFYDWVVFCGTLTVGLAVALGGVSGGYLIRKRRQAKQP